MLIFFRLNNSPADHKDNPADTPEKNSSLACYFFFLPDLRIPTFAPFPLLSAGMTFPKDITEVPHCTTVLASRGDLSVLYTDNQSAPQDRMGKS